MGNVFKQKISRPLPENATVVTRRTKNGTELVASWKDRTGKKRSAAVVTAADGLQRIRTESATYYAKFRDGNDIVQIVPTGCRDKQAALSMLDQLQTTADKVRVGSITNEDLEIGKHSRLPTLGHLKDYVESLKQSKRHGGRIKETEKRITEVVDGCKFERLADLNADAFVSWLATESDKGRSPSVLNAYIEVMVSFGYWLAGKRVANKRSNLLGEKRLTQNPMAGIGKYDVESDRRRKRRALTEPELNRLLFVARWRPLAEYGRETETKTGEDRPTDTKSRKTWTLKPLSMDGTPEAVERAKTKLADNPEFVAKLDRRGWERSLIYKVAVLTGLRRGEIESLTLEHLELDESQPFIRMRPQDTKNRQAIEIPLRVELADDLRRWVASKQGPLNGVLSLETKRKGLPLSTPVFGVPKQLVKALDRDLKAAGIPKIDDRKRTVDFHAMRTAFGTLLSTSGVAPRTAQQAMRHSTINLTMNTYTDPRLLDVAGAVDALPMLRLSTEPTLPANQGEQRATGTDGGRAIKHQDKPRTVTPAVTPDTVFSIQNVSNSDNEPVLTEDRKQQKNPAKTIVSTGFPEWALRDLNPRPSRCKRGGDDHETTEIAGFADADANRYPNGYPCDADLMQLADDLRARLNADELRRLVELLATGAGN